MYSYKLVVSQTTKGN